MLMSTIFLPFRFECMTESLKQIFNNPAEEGLFGPHAFNYGPILLLTGIKPVFLTNMNPNRFDAPFAPLLKAAVLEGRLQCFSLPYDRILEGIRRSGTNLYYCHPDKIDNALELRSIFHALHTRPAELSQPEHVRVGQLLGYSDNDCALFGVNHYTPEQIAYLRQTNDVRRAQRYGAIVQEFEFKMRSDPESLIFV